MTRSHPMTAVLLTIAVLPAAAAEGAGVLADELKFFEPLTGRDWVGHYSDPETAHFEHLIAWEPILGGKAVREVKRVAELEFHMETLFYWDPEAGRVEFVRQTNRGQLSTGTVQGQGGTVVLLGRNHDDGRRYRITYDATNEGTVEDRFELVDAVEGARGHLIVYESDDAGAPFREPGGGPAEEARATGEMVLVPGGSFSMGESGAENRSPVHDVSLDAYLIDATEVTNAQYLAFCEDTGHELPFFWERDGFRCGPEYPNHPVIGVSWYDAAAYAAWCGKRLPTEAEWERAARGGLEHQSFPWGNAIAPENANYTKSELDGTVAVGSYEPNGLGIHDVSGNVGEWVSDWYDAGYYAMSPAHDPPGPESGTFKVIRGGGWHSGPGCVNVYRRNAIPSNWLDWNVGFRCARDADDPAER